MKFTNTETIPAFLGYEIKNRLEHLARYASDATDDEQRELEMLLAFVTANDLLVEKKPGSCGIPVKNTLIVDPSIEGLCFVQLDYVPFDVTWLIRDNNLGERVIFLGKSYMMLYNK